MEQRYKNRRAKRTIVGWYKDKKKRMAEWKTFKENLKIVCYIIKAVPIYVGIEFCIT